MRKRYKVNITFTRVLLGAVPKDPAVYEKYIASKAALSDERLAEELSTVEKVEEKGWTGFHSLENGRPFLYDYVPKGFFKDACSMLRREEGTLSSKIKAYRKIIDGLVFIFPDKIPLIFEGEMGILERPLRASTAQGERIALARSDTCPVGTTMEFEVLVLGKDVTEALLREWLEYGALRGLGQWRNSGAGRFWVALTSLLESNDLVR